MEVNAPPDGEGLDDRVVQHLDRQEQEDDAADAGEP